MSESEPVRLLEEIVGLSHARPFQLARMRCGEGGLDVSGIQEESTGLHTHPATQGDGPYKVEEHCHGFYEIVLAQAGSAIHTAGEDRRELARGDVLLLTPEGVHGIEGIRTFRWTNIYLRPDWLFEDLRLLWQEEGLVRYLLADALFHLGVGGGIYHLRTTEEETEQWEAEVGAFVDEVHKPRSSLAMLNGIFLKILAVLNKAFLRDNPGDALPLQPEIWVAAQHVERAITQCQRFRVEAVAEAAGMSVAHFGRHFREATGLSPMDYFQRRRVQHAARLLSAPQTSVTDVAYRLGFADSSHLSRLFKRIMEVSPKEYQQRAGHRA